MLQNVTQYRIAKDTGVAQSKLSGIKKGLENSEDIKAIKIGNLTLDVASRLTEYAKEVQEKG
ncbi:XRE family transcriptional regulator [Streptococcus sp. zg-JUN1979]|uniref:XRE family transcriptional regulator n=1 Tax=Streptococcus sp. zg-JUN1979 TaxID=3391450 RepID=UPI0039A434C1